VKPPKAPSKTGVVLVDKPAGMTSHDVVSRLRRALGERRVGHAGTLDPMATGLLVGLVGEATKLEPYVASASKSYVAAITLGRSTDTLDAEGATTEVADLAPWLEAELAAGATGDLDRAPRVRAALDTLQARTHQVPPAHSAIHVDGTRSYELARRGVAVALPPRPAKLLTCEWLPTVPRVEGPTIHVFAHVEKGFYVRAFARDLCELLEVPGHLSALRRTASGGFRLEDATPLESVGSARLLSLEAALERAGVPLVALSEVDAEHVRHGRALPPRAELVGTVALLGPSGRLLAVADASERAIRVSRGFSG
jgi:tRNA pseudouridine55 synthase